MINVFVLLCFFVVIYLCFPDSEKQIDNTIGDIPKLTDSLLSANFTDELSVPFWRLLKYKRNKKGKLVAWS